MKIARPCLLIVTLLLGCSRTEDSSTGPTVSLVEARNGFKTRLARRPSVGEPAEVPPPALFFRVFYDSPAGSLAAYVTPDPGDGKKHPAIVWITGGDCNTIGDVWSDAPEENDQTAAAYRRAGIVMMFPSLRGGNKNPGVKEGFLGEVDDVLAAAADLAGRNYVDADRIYLGGHSTGGTLALLTAECPNKFRAVFAFGPADDVAGYPDMFLPFDTSRPREVELRSPVHWLRSIATPTFVIEGSDGNIRSLRTMASATTNPLVHFVEVAGADHFNVLAPANRIICEKILKDDGPTCNVTLASSELR